MKKSIYVGLVVSFLIHQATFGANQEGGGALDDSQVSRIAVALRHNPSELTAFLEMVASKKEPPTPLEETPVPDEYEDFLSKVPYERQITLLSRDILEGTAKAQAFQAVFRIDLSDFDFGQKNDETLRKICDYFSKNALHNLRQLGLRSTQNVSVFIDELFGKQAPKDKFVSLLRIDATRSDIENKDLETIYTYFSDSSYFIRDISQRSDRYKVPAAFVLVEAANAPKIRVDGWRVGKKNPFSKTIFYRSEEQPTKGPLIMEING
ncbi:MAG: hypothetical protein WCG04_06195 [Alphaproteobacteria bacterium]